MANLRNLDIPRDLAKRGTSGGKGIAVFNVSVAEHSGVVTQLQAAGFQIERETEEETRLVKPKRMGGQELAMLLVGLLCFVIPAIIYFMIWSRQPTPVAVVRSVDG
jgi:hypothetical protein